MRRYMREFLDVVYPGNPGGKVAQEPAIIDATRMIRRLRSVLSAAQYQLEVEETAADVCRERCEQHLDDLGVIRLMIDPDSRFKAETVVWIVNWLRGHKRIQPPKKTEKGWA